MDAVSSLDDVYASYARGCAKVQMLGRRRNVALPNPYSLAPLRSTFPRGGFCALHTAECDGARKGEQTAPFGFGYPKAQHSDTGLPMMVRKVEKEVREEDELMGGPRGRFGRK